mgnify:CR=1 FL=1
MNKSFKKIINLEENISIDDLKRALEYFITIEDSDLKEQFLSKCKSVIISLLNNILPLVDEYPTSISYDRTVFKIDRLLYWANFLYGNKIFSLFNRNIQNIKDNSLYLNSLARYRNNVNIDLFDDKELLLDLDMYTKSIELKSKYSDISKSVLEDAYYLYFSLNNFLDKEDYEERKRKFMDKNNICPGTLKDYVETYGNLYLNIPLKKIEKMINFVESATSHLSNDFFKFEGVLNDIINSNDTNYIKEIVFTNHLSPYIIKSFIEKYRFYNRKYSNNLDNIIKKINTAIKSLEKEHKYIHYSIALTEIENSNDLEEIKIIVKNNMIYLTNDNIERFITIYRAVLDDKKKQELENELLKKTEIAKEDIKKENATSRTLGIERRKENLYNSIDFNIFLSSDIKSKDDFCKLMDIKESDFNTLFSMLEVRDNELYLKIKEKIRNLQGQRYAVLINKVNSIADNIINGIKLEDGSRRNFEILDYFLSTKLDFNEFIDLYNKNRNIDIESLKVIKIFFAKNKLTNKLNINQELDGTTIFMIDDKPYEVSKEEKQTVLNYLRVKEIPLYIKVYKQALKRHINGNLILDDDKKLIKKG